MKHVHATELENMLADYKTRQSRQRRLVQVQAEHDRIQSVVRNAGMGYVQLPDGTIVKKHKFDWLYKLSIPIYLIGGVIVSAYCVYQMYPVIINLFR